MYFVKFWIFYLVYVYVMRKSCDKTHFCKIYAVWQLFSRFLVVSVMKGLLGMVGNVGNA